MKEVNDRLEPLAMMSHLTRNSETNRSRKPLRITNNENGVYQMYSIHTSWIQQFLLHFFDWANTLNET